MDAQGHPSTTVISFGSQRNSFLPKNLWKAFKKQASVFINKERNREFIYISHDISPYCNLSFEKGPQNLIPCINTLKYYPQPTLSPIKWKNYVEVIGDLGTQKEKFPNGVQ